MPANKTAVCNLALSHLGVSVSITDIASDTSVAGVACNLFYDDVLAEVLTAHPWPFATKQAALSLVGSAPTTEWGYSYRFPSDAVAFRRVLHATPLRVEAERTTIPFRISRDGTGRLVYTDVQNAVGEYTELVTTTTLWPADFSQLVSLLLAHRIGPRVAKGDQLKLSDRALALYKDKLKESIETVLAEERKHAPEITVASKPKENIVNAALAHLGVNHEVQDLTNEKTRPARIGRQFYNDARDETLRALPWSFATKFATLTLVGAAPNDEWPYSYRYPTDCVQVRKIINTSNRLRADVSRNPFKLGQDGTGLLIFADQASAKVEYTVQHDTPSQYPADFRQAMALKLAVMMAPALIPVDKVDPVAKRAKELYEEAIATAAANAAREERDLGPETVAASEPKEDICNAAMLHLGLSQEILDLETETSLPARTFRQLYDKTRDQVLRDFPWPIATKIAALVEVDDDPNAEWAYSYRYPSDCILLRRILNGTTRVRTIGTDIPFRLSHDSTGKLIFCDLEDAEAEYTAQLDDATKYYTADFREVFALLLAGYAAPRLMNPKDDPKLTERGIRVRRELLALYNHRLGATQANAANEEQTDVEADGELLRSRE